MLDEQLMERIVAGNMEALGILFERHKQPLFAFLSRFMHDQTLAEDVLVEAFFRLYDRRRTYRQECKFTTWLYTIAHHLAIDQLKSASRQEQLMEQMLHDTPTTTDDQGQIELERAEFSHRVRDAVGRLPVDQRAVIILRVYHDLSYREIADIIGANEETVRVRAHRARQALKQTLGAVIEEDPCGR